MEENVENMQNVMEGKTGGQGSIEREEIQQEKKIMLYHDNKPLYGNNNNPMCMYNNNPIYGNYNNHAVCSDNNNVMFGDKNAFVQENNNIYDEDHNGILPKNLVLSGDYSHRESDNSSFPELIEMVFIENNNILHWGAPGGENIQFGNK